MTPFTTGATLAEQTWLDSTLAVVEASGELDLYAAPRLRDALMEVHRAGRSRVIVDMTAVDFMDSSRLGVLIGGVKRARNANGALVVVGTPERLMKILRVTGVVRVMPAFVSLWEAFAYFDQATLKAQAH